MTNQRYAAIDLGTNTFHILIAEKLGDGRFKKIHQQRVYVYLGRDGVAHINQESFQKGIETIGLFAALLSEHKVDDYKMTGTETFRHADNGQEFINLVREKFSLDIDIIDGQEEAAYIYKGVLAYLSPPYGKYLIMDIGGGSVEFIYFDTDKMHYSKSFPIGISVLYNKFQNSDPLSDESIEKIQSWLKAQLKDLSVYLKTVKVDALVGSAGSFEVLSSILEASLQKKINERFTKEEFEQIYKEIFPLSQEERLSYPGIVKERVLLIPIAMVLINHILNEYAIQEILVSPYALKEGVISDFIS